MGHSLLAACILIVACASGVRAEPPLTAPADLVLPYAGRFRANPRLQDVLTTVGATRAVALDIVRRRLGLAADDRFVPWIRFRDALDLHQRFAFPVPAHRMVTTTEVQPDGPRVVVTIHTEFVVRGGYDFTQDLVHEMTHAVMRRHAGDAYEAIPAWVREGAALWTAGQGPASVRIHLALPESLDHPEALVHGLTDRMTLHDYPEAFLAFDYLESTCGVEAVRRWIGALLRGRSWKRSLLDAAGQDWPAFQQGARQHALAELTRVVDPALTEYRVLWEMARDLDAPGAAARLIDGVRAFVAAHGDATLRRPARLLEARALIRLGDPEAARTGLLEVIHPGAPACGYEAEALVRLGSLDEARGDLPQAVSTFERLVSEHPDSSHFPEGLYRWGLGLAASDRSDRARQMLELALASFPDHPLAEAARRALR